MDDDFNYFVDSLIVAAADKQATTDVRWLEFAQLCSEVQQTCPPTWIGLATERVRKLDYGRFCVGGSSGHIFKINAAGIAHAAEVRRERRPLTFGERLAAVPRTDWISLAALIVAAIALFKPGY